MQYLLLQLGLCLESSLVIGARQHEEMMMKIIQLKDELLSGIESMLLCVLRKTTLVQLLHFLWMTSKEYSECHVQCMTL
jgi:hypothetical protein